MAHFTPDYEHLYMQEEFSDVTLVVQDENEATSAGQKRKRKTNGHTLPGHCLLLLGHSGYCKAKLENWKNEAGSSSGNGSKQQLEIVLPVPAGQLELAELLIKGIYQKQPTITESLSHVQLLQLMLLADRFEVPKVQAAVAAAFGSVKPQQLEWETALQLLDLPPSCAQQAEFKAVQQLAVQRLQQQLGDLEEVWADEQLQQQLLALPFNALLQLLQHADTRVATENTVVFSIERWYREQAGVCDEQQLRQLMHLVRVRHCTPYFAGTVMPQSDLVQLCFEPSELLLMHVCCTPGAHASLLNGAKCPAVLKYPAWGAAQRPASASQPILEWQVPLDTVQAVVNRHLGSSSISTNVATSHTYVVQGQSAHLTLKVYGDSSSGNRSITDDVDTGNSSRALALGAFLRLRAIPSNAVRKVSATFTLATIQSASIGRRQSVTDIRNTFSGRFMSADFNLGFARLVDLGRIASWEAAESVLRQKQLVHAGGQGDGSVGPHLLVKVEVLELL